MKQALGVVGTVIVIVAVLVGLWFGGWWIRRESVQRSAEIRQDTFARQQALQTTVIDLHRDVRNIDVQLTTATEDQRGPLEAQRVAIVTDLCDSYIRITERTLVPVEVETFARQEC